MANDGTFKDGFIEGYKAVRGNSTAIPAIPAALATHAGKTPFQVGLLEGMKAANR